MLHTDNMLQTDMLHVTQAMLPDMLFDAIDQLEMHMSKGRSVIISSTIPHAFVLLFIIKKRPQLAFSDVTCNSVTGARLEPA